MASPALGQMRARLTMKVSRDENVLDDGGETPGDELKMGVGSRCNSKASISPGGTARRYRRRSDDSPADPGPRRRRSGGETPIRFLRKRLESRKGTDSPKDDAGRSADSPLKRVLRPTISQTGRNVDEGSGSPRRIVARKSSSEAPRDSPLVANQALLPAGTNLPTKPNKRILPEDLDVESTRGVLSSVKVALRRHRRTSLEIDFEEDTAVASLESLHLKGNARDEQGKTDRGDHHARSWMRNVRRSSAGDSLDPSEYDKGDSLDAADVPPDRRRDEGDYESPAGTARSLKIALRRFGRSSQKGDLGAAGPSGSLGSSEFTLGRSARKATKPTGPARIGRAELEKHNVVRKPGTGESDAWIVVRGLVYDISGYIAEHPGGPSLLTGLAGTDATEDFEDAHGGCSVAKNRLDELYIGAYEENGSHQGRSKPRSSFMNTLKALGLSK